MRPNKAVWALNAMVLIGVICILLGRSEMILTFMILLAIGFVVGVTIYMVSRSWKRREPRQTRGFEVIVPEEKQE